MSGIRAQKSKMSCCFDIDMLICGDLFRLNTCCSEETGAHGEKDEAKHKNLRREKKTTHRSDILIMEIYIYMRFKNFSLCLSIILARI